MSRSRRRPEAQNDVPEYLGRIAYNATGWRRPSEQRAKESGASYVKGNGFGHEDWLFRDEWTIDGWRYAFLQGVNKSYNRLLEKGPHLFNMTLFAIEPDGRRRYIARIENMHLVESDAAAIAVALFRRRGWYNTMVSEIRAVSGNVKALGDTNYAPDVFNVRFRLEDVQICGPEAYANTDDYACRIKHYVISRVDAPVAMPRPVTGGASRIASVAEKMLRSIEPFLRRGTSPVMCTPEHMIMERNLLALLTRKYSRDRIDFEIEGIDVLRESLTERTIYEIKSDARPLMAIRQALGQLLEYAMVRLPRDNRLLRLVVVGRNPLSEKESTYLDLLRTEYKLPVHYQVISARLGKNVSE